MAADAQNLYELAPWGFAVPGMTFWGDSPYIFAVTVVKTQTGIARVTLTVLRTQTGVARIALITTRDQTGKSRITATTLQTQLGVANIRNAVLRDQTGKAFLNLQQLRTQTGIALIDSGITQKFQTGKASVLNTVTRDQTGRSSLVYQILQIQTGRASIAAAVLKTQTGTARIVFGIDVREHSYGDVATEPQARVNINEDKPRMVTPLADGRGVAVDPDRPMMADAGQVYGEGF